MELILILLSATQGSDVALRACTLLVSAWGRAQGEGGNDPLWYLAWGLKGETWAAKSDYKRDQIFLCQWFHDRERRINFFLWECQLCLPHLPLPLLSFCTPKTSSGMSVCISVHWSYPQAQSSSNPGVSYPILQLWIHWLAAHCASQLSWFWLNP